MPKPIAGFDADLIWSKVLVGPGCWMWTGTKLAQGYGAVKCKGGTMRKAHRVVWTIIHGEIPPGMFILEGFRASRARGMGGE